MGRAPYKSAKVEGRHSLLDYSIYNSTITVNVAILKEAPPIKFYDLLKSATSHTLSLYRLTVEMNTRANSCPCCMNELRKHYSHVMGVHFWQEGCLGTKLMFAS